MFPMLGQVTLDSNAPDVTAYITAFAATYGPIVGAALAVWFAFLAVRLGLRWARRAA